MKLEPISGSSVIKAAGYDPATNVMRVELHSGKVYDHTDVPMEKFAAFLGSGSHGTFWNKRIRNQYTVKPVK